MKLDTECKLREMVGEKVVFIRGKKTTDMSKVVSFNATSAYLWETLQGKDFVLDDVVAALTREYEVSEEVARADSARWIEDMKSAGLMQEE